MYKSDNSLHRSLDDREEFDFIAYADQTCIRVLNEYKAQNKLIHPVIMKEIDACISIIKERLVSIPEPDATELGRQIKLGNEIADGVIDAIRGING